MKKHRPYQLVEYDPEWKNIFLDTSKKLKSILGDHLIRTEHIGSTSIEGMVAKPQVDLLAVVKSFSSIKDIEDSFEKNGFTVHGFGYVSDDDYYVSKDNEEGARLISIHILQESDPKIAGHTLFRDYLSENIEERDLYIKVKKELYSKYPNNYAAYDSGKKDVIQTIKQRAEKWTGS